MSATVFHDSAGELATLTVVWRNAAGTATDATTTLAVIDPTNTTTTYSSFTHTALTGTYAKDVPCTVPGEYIGIFDASGALSDRQVVRWTVFDSDAVLYCSVESVKSRLGDDETVDDTEYEGAVRSVSNWIDEYCQDFFGRVTATRTFVPDNRYELVIPPLVSVTTLKTDDNTDGTYETTWTSGTDYQLLPYNTNTGRYTKPYDKVKVVGSKTFPVLFSILTRTNVVEIAGVWGWPAVPDAVREAALILSVDTLSLKDTKFGVLGFGAEGFTVRAKQNPQALAYLQPYRRYPAMVA